MMLDAYKELAPVVYGENAVKHLHTKHMSPGRLCFSMHWHERMELLCVTAGSLEIHSEDGHFTLKTGQVAVFGPRQMHGGFAGSEGVEYHTFMFDVEKFCNATLASDKYLLPLSQGQVTFRKCIEDEQLLQTIHRLIAIKDDREKRRSPLITVGVIYEIIGILYQYCEESARIVHRSDKGFGAILEYVNEHYTEKISPREVSGRFGYNETYFCRRFKEITGLTFVRYIQVLRMELAQKLLKNTKDEIGIISWKCGYADVSYFSNCFRKHFGYSPTEFREMKDE